jgi:hypothetical protein
LLQTIARRSAATFQAPLSPRSSIAAAIRSATGRELSRIAAWAVTVSPASTARVIFSCCITAGAGSYLPITVVAWRRSWRSAWVLRASHIDCNLGGDDSSTHLVWSIQSVKHEVRRSGGSSREILFRH